MENPCTNLCYVSRGKAYSYHVRKSPLPTAGISPTDGSLKNPQDGCSFRTKGTPKRQQQQRKQTSFFHSTTCAHITFSLLLSQGRNQTDSAASVNNFDYGGYLYFLCLHRVLGTFLNLHSLYKKEDGRLFVRPNI